AARPTVVAPILGWALFPEKWGRQGIMGRKRSKRPARKVGFWRRWSGLLWKLALVGVVALAGLVIYLDAVIQEKFSGKRWAVPAKVFARPLELYAGQQLTRDDFVTELTALGYRRVNAVAQPGQMSVGSGRVGVYTRGFQSFEGPEPAQRVSVRFDGKQIAGLSGNGAAVTARLEALMQPGQMSVGSGRVDVYTRGFQSFEGSEPAQRISVRFDGKQIAGLSGNGDVVMARIEPLMIGGIYPAHNEDRILVRLDQAPPYLI